MDAWVISYVRLCHTKQFQYPWCYQHPGALMQIEDIVRFKGDSSYLTPGYYIAVDHHSRDIVWGIRGTRRLPDLVGPCIEHTHRMHYMLNFPLPMLAFLTYRTPASHAAH